MGLPKHTQPTRFGWSNRAGERPDILLDVTTQNFNHTTLRPSASFVDRLVRQYLLGPNGPMDDRTPRAAMIVDKGGKTFGNRQRFEDFVRQTIELAGHQLLSTQRDLMAPVTLEPANAAARDSSFRPFAMTQPGPDAPINASVTITKPDGVATGQAVDYIPNGTTPKFAHLDLVRWPLVAVVYGDNTNLAPGTGIPFLLDARQGFKETNHTLEESFIGNTYPDGEQAVFLSGSARKALLPYQLSAKTHVVEDLDLSAGHDRLAMIFFNSPLAHAQVFHGADPKPLVLDAQAQTRRPITNIAFHVKPAM
ncbi:MAG: hypothetical protein KC474_04120 [Cyanobacteria bacterium HKST-UBA04]|nr:hypothetical protein [Cyanobacteria bacterium HKST-UBA04]